MTLSKTHINERAIWIIDEAYLLPCYLSVQSFYQHNDLPGTIIYCGGKEDAYAQVFKSIHDSIEFDYYSTDYDFSDLPDKATIINRLARMDIVCRYSEELIFLFDADVLFAKGSQLLTHHTEITKMDEACIWGYPEASPAHVSYLYFGTKDKEGRDIKYSPQEMSDTYTSVFGDDWQYILSGNGLNNGVLAFYKCRDVAYNWKQFYLQGLEHTGINSADDQLPLSAAITVNKCTVEFISRQFNSMGEIQGDYAIFHAFSGIWKGQLQAVFNDDKNLSDFSSIVGQILEDVPTSWKSRFILENDMRSPYKFRQIPGDFRFKHLYDDLLNGLEEGICVEVGGCFGKSACYMAERIVQLKKDIEFITVANDDHDQTSLKAIHENLTAAGVEKNVQIISSSVINHTSKFKLGSLDFVFLNEFHTYQNIYDNLSKWYPFIRTGGVLAGYDYSAQDGIHYGGGCPVFDFCQKHGLSFRIDFDIYIIEKLTHIDPIQENSILTESLNNEIKLEKV